MSLDSKKRSDQHLIGSNMDSHIHMFNAYALW